MYNWLCESSYVGIIDCEAEFFMQQGEQSQQYSYSSNKNNFPPPDASYLNEESPSNQHTTSIDQTNITSVSDDTPLPKKKDRKDAHTFSQNISSKTKSFVCKLLAGKTQKDRKLKVKYDYKFFLKEHKVQNNQMILVFTYLFLLQSYSPKQLYFQFKNQFLAHLQGKRSELQNELQKKKGERQALQVKIKANIDILIYIFSLEGGGQIDWQKVKKFCQPLFQGRQKKRINAPLQTGMKIQQSILSSRQLYRNIKSNQALNTQCL